MRRIEDNASVEELQARFQGGVNDPEILREMLECLSGRQGLRATDLRGKVIARLSQLQASIFCVSLAIDEGTHGPVAIGATWVPLGR